MSLYLETIQSSLISVSYLSTKVEMTPLSTSFYETVMLYKFEYLSIQMIGYRQHRYYLNSVY